MDTRDHTEQGGYGYRKICVLPNGEDWDVGKYLGCTKKRARP
ncbi:MAG: hypothetical protein JWQ42_2228 [Edaphobacter sp.]|nr:hypothetical protein [Edaphobacter sp.]